jgi:hypothetical protein
MRREARCGWLLLFLLVCPCPGLRTAHTATHSSMFVCVCVVVCVRACVLCLFVCVCACVRV